ncbi:kinesin-like protein KIN-5D [Trifolium pratense]|nr:kinesin-like protein KIN-5D [Trifolium pratense]
MDNKDTFDPPDFHLNGAKQIDKAKGSLENKHAPLLLPSADSSFLGDTFIPGQSYPSNIPLKCPVPIKCASIAKVSEKGKGSVSLKLNNKGFGKQVKIIPILAERRNSRSLWTQEETQIEENIQTNTNEDLVKTFLQQMCVFALLKKFGIGCLVHYLSMNLIVHMLIKEFKDYKENFEKTSIIELHDLQQKYKLLVSKLEEKECCIQQQEEGLNKSKESTESVSVAALEFFENIATHSSRVMKLSDVAQEEISQKFADFENKFKEEAERHEEETKNQISTILANSRSESVAMVSEASQIMKDAYGQQPTMVQKEMVEMMKFSDEAKKMVIKLKNK